MRKKTKMIIDPKYILIAISVICAILIVVSFFHLPSLPASLTFQTFSNTLILLTGCTFRCPSGGSLWYSPNLNDKYWS